MWDAMRRMADNIGAVADDATLLRLANNAAFALPTAGLVIRINRSLGLRDRTYKNVLLGDWFALVDAPTIRLAHGMTQPIADGDLLATVWQLIEPREPQPSVTELGHVLRTFHGLGLPDEPLPLWDPLGDTRTRVKDAEGLDDGDRNYLLDWCDRLEPRLDDYIAQQPIGLVHGDAIQANLLRGTDGRVLLCDFDGTCRGPQLVDLVPTPVNEARFRRPGGHAQLVAGYGYDITTDRAWPLLRDARELKMVVGALPRLASEPHAAEEFQRRLDSIRAGDTTARWIPFAQLAR
ncbi:phosphotransferase [Actinoplanes sp. NPDC048988]|uniref:phosphotransferase n=1 Tax=Actinoplanes sp. NPDC048988 TaxID=3363901 RepID=UPI003716239B